MVPAGSGRRMARTVEEQQEWPRRGYAGDMTATHLKILQNGVSKEMPAGFNIAMCGGNVK